MQLVSMQIEGQLCSDVVWTGIVRTILRIIVGYDRNCFNNLMCVDYCRYDLDGFINW